MGFLTPKDDATFADLSQSSTAPLAASGPQQRVRLTPQGAILGALLLVMAVLCSAAIWILVTAVRNEPRVQLLAIESEGGVLTLDGTAEDAGVVAVHLPDSLRAQLPSGQSGATMRCSSSEIRPVVFSLGADTQRVSLSEAKVKSMLDAMTVSDDARCLLRAEGVRERVELTA